MNKKLTIALLSLVLAAGSASVQGAASNQPPAQAKDQCCACCTVSKKDCKRLHAAEAKALKQDPSLMHASREKLHQAMIKADSRIKELLMKVCPECKKQNTQNTQNTK